MDEKIRYWVELAEYDLETAKDQLFRSLTDDRCKSILERTEDLFTWIKQQLSNQ